MMLDDKYTYIDGLLSLLLPFLTGVNSIILFSNTYRSVRTI